MNKSQRNLTKQEKWILLFVVLAAIILGILASTALQAIFFR